MFDIMKGCDMNNLDMYEKSFQRPRDFFKLSGAEQWEIDKRLGILDWDGSHMTSKQMERYIEHYDV